MEEKAGLNQVMHPVQHNAFHDFPIFELKLHPDAMHHWGVGEELQIVAVSLAFEAFDKENSLQAVDRDFAEGVVLGAAEAEHIGKTTKTLNEKAFEFLPLVGFDVTFKDLTAGLNDNFVELDFLTHPGSGAT